MADKNLVALTVNTFLVGLVLLSLLSFYILVVNNEGQGAIFDANPEIQDFNMNLTGYLDTANSITNLSTEYNPEVSISGADQKGTAIGVQLQNPSVGTWKSIAIFFSLVFGSVWTSSISGLLLALLSIIFTYYLIRWIRSGN